MHRHTWSVPQIEGQNKLALVEDPMQQQSSFLSRGTGASRCRYVCIVHFQQFHEANGSLQGSEVLSNIMNLVMSMSVRQIHIESFSSPSNGHLGSVLTWENPPEGSSSK